MKNCPKCHGKGNIKNYYKIDGGMCYECSGKGWVSDSHKMYQKPRVYAVPEWVKQKEDKLINEAHKVREDLVDRVNGVLKQKKGLSREFVEILTTNEEKHLIKLSGYEFVLSVENYFKDYSEILKESCPEYF